MKLRMLKYFAALPRAIQLLEEEWGVILRSALFLTLQAQILLDEIRRLIH